MGNDELRKLREQLRGYTLQILDLAQLRTDASVCIAEIKDKYGLPTCDPEQEKRIIDGARGYAESIGLDPDFTEKLVTLLMDYSKRIQDEFRKSIPESASTKND